MKKTISVFIASFLSIPTVILICVACAFLSAFIYIQKIDNFKSNVTNLYSYIDSVYESQLTRTESIVESTVINNYLNDPNNPTYSTEIIRTLFNTFNVEDNVLEVTLLAPDGSVLLSSSNPDEMLEPNQIDTLVYQKVMETHEPYTTLKFKENVPLLKIGYPILENGEIRAIYLRYTPLNYINYFAQNLNENEESIYLITDDSTGIVYSTGDTNRILSITDTQTDNIPDEVTQLVNLINSSGGSGSGTVNFSINNQSIVGYYQILSNLNWICMISQPRALILYDLNIFQLTTLLIAGFYILFANISVRRFFGKYLDTIDNFTKATENFENGEHNVRFQADEGFGNLSKLGKGMNRILDQVEQLEISNANLTDELNMILSTDPVTKLLNNRALYREIDSKFGNSPNQLLIMFNTGVFEKLNETFGNSIANRLLEIIAESIREYETDEFHTARLAQDSFCIFVENFEDINEVHHKLNELRLRLEAINHIDDLEIELYPNIVAVFRDEHLLGRSDWLRLATEVLEESSLPGGSFTIFDFTNVSEINHRKPEYIQNILVDNMAFEGFSKSNRSVDNNSNKENDNN